MVNCKGLSSIYGLNTISDLICMYSEFFKIPKLFFLVVRPSWVFTAIKLLSIPKVRLTSQGMTFHCQKKKKIVHLQMILKRHNIISVIYHYSIGENGIQNVLLITSTSACPTPLEICFAILNAYPTYFF
jgi:hypothetical protein